MSPTHGNFIVNDGTATAEDIRRLIERCRSEVARAIRRDAARRDRLYGRIRRHPMTLIPGARLGVFEIVALVGAGGMGEVYRARDTRWDATSP